MVLSDTILIVLLIIVHGQAIREIFGSYVDNPEICRITVEIFEIQRQDH